MANTCIDDITIIDWLFECILWCGMIWLVECMYTIYCIHWNECCVNIIKVDNYHGIHKVIKTDTQLLKQTKQKQVEFLIEFSWNVLFIYFNRNIINSWQYKRVIWVAKFLSPVASLLTQNVFFCIFWLLLPYRLRICMMLLWHPWAFWAIQDGWQDGH